MPSGKGKRLAPTGNLSIERAQEFRNELLGSLRDGGSCTLDLSGVEQIGLPCLQVLLAARNYAREGGAKLLLTGTVQEAVSRRLRLCGFAKIEAKTGEELDLALPLPSEAAS